MSSNETLNYLEAAFHSHLTERGKVGAREVLGYIAKAVAGLNHQKGLELQNLIRRPGDTSMLTDEKASFGTEPPQPFKKKPIRGVRAADLRSKTPIVLPENASKEETLEAKIYETKENLQKAKVEKAHEKGSLSTTDQSKEMVQGLIEAKPIDLAKEHGAEGLRDLMDVFNIPHSEVPNNGMQLAALLKKELKKQFPK